MPEEMTKEKGERCMRKKMIAFVACALLTGSVLFAGCGKAANGEGTPAAGGVLVLSVNPEIAIEYDQAGIVTGVTARNDDALTIINGCEGLIGKETRSAVTDLVTVIGQAGYFVQEADGENREITLEIEEGSSLPHDAFMDEIVADVRTCVGTNQWTAPLNVENESQYGLEDYVDTDYGPNNDGVTNYDTSVPATGGGAAAPGEDDTDYGPNNDGVTDYNATIPVPGNGGTSAPAPAPGADDTDYGPNNDGVTNYDAPASTDGDTDYGSNNDGVTNYDTPAPAPAPAPAPDNGGSTNYDGGQSNYDSDSSDSDSDSDD